MSKESIREHLRSALSEVVSAEEQRLRGVYAQFDKDLAAKIEKLRPALSTLRVLSDEVEGASGVAISVAEIGHMATVKIGSGGLSHTLSLSISSSNDSFRIEETKSDSLLDEYATHVHEFQVAEQALELIINAVGKHIAQAAVLKERVK